MNIWLTSKKGFLGEELFRRLEREYNTFATDREEVNLLNSQEVDKFIHEKKIDVIIHNAIKGGRRTKPDDCSIFYQNILMFENIAKNSGKVFKIINFDSAASFDRRENICNFKESDLGKHVPSDYYGLSKMNVALRSLNIKNSYNLRIFNCFGECETDDRVTKANIIRYIRGENLIVHKNKYMDIFYIQDLWTVLQFYLNNKVAPKDLNLVYEEKNNLIEIMEIINNLENKKNEILVYEEGLEKYYTGDSSLIKSLNFNFLGIESGIHNMYKNIIKEMKENE
jgi:dTDP-4-dehydrorhamnose reductase